MPQMKVPGIPIEFQTVGTIQMNLPPTMMKYPMSNNNI